jgi:hypothetical protein
MEIFNLFLYYLVYYFITSVSFYNKILFFISFSIIISCFNNIDNMKNSDNLFINLLFLILSSIKNCFMYFKKLFFSIMKLKLVKILLNYLKIVDKCYIDGKNYILLKITSRFNTSSIKPNIKKKKKKKIKNESCDDVFKNDSEMYDFLDKLKKK